MIPVHIINTFGSDLSDQLIIGKMNITTASGGAGAEVVTAVAFPETIPLPYHAIIMGDDDAVWHVTDKTSLGFNLKGRPRLAANSLAGGTVTLLVIA